MPDNEKYTEQYFINLFEKSFMNLVTMDSDETLNKYFSSIFEESGYLRSLDYKDPEYFRGKVNKAKTQQGTYFLSYEGYNFEFVLDSGYIIRLLLISGAPDKFKIMNAKCGTAKLNGGVFKTA